jgi:O-Antigen ligase
MPRPLIDSGNNFLTQARLLDRAIFAFLALFAICLPFSIKGAERSWKITLVLWLVKLAVDRVRPLRQPLVAPLLAFVLLSAFSTVLSPDPYLSWDRMKFVCLVLAGIVIAQNVTRLSQVRWLVVLLVLSGFMASLYTGWQYTYGIGVQLEQFPASSRLAQTGFRTNDIVTAIGGRHVHNSAQLIEALKQLPVGAEVPVKYVRFMATRSNTVVATAEDFIQSGLGTPAMQLKRGRPFRAQGTLGHYVVFAEMLMQVGCLAWALLLVSSHERGWALIFGLAFVGVTTALMMTETRAALAGVVVGCLLSLLLLGKGMLRWVAVGALIAIVAGATLWIQHTRGLSWVDRDDVGTQFRVLMWEDGIRLVRGHPWFGVGMETVHLHWREWNIRGFIQYHVQSHFHSTYLQIAVERGIPALLAWLWFSAAYIVFLLRLVLRLRTQNRLACGVAAGVLAGFVAFTFTSFFHYNLGEEPLAMLLFFSFGVAVALDRITKAEGAPNLPAS